MIAGATEWSHQPAAGARRDIVTGSHRVAAARSLARYLTGIHLTAEVPPGRARP